MEHVVIFNGHRIVVKHHLDSMKLLVDDTIYDEVSGIINTNRDNVFTAQITNTEGLSDEIQVVYEDAKLSKLMGKLSFFYNGKLIAEKKTL